MLLNHTRLDGGLNFDGLTGTDLLGFISPPPVYACLCTPNLYIPVFLDPFMHLCIFMHGLCIPSYGTIFWFFVLPPPLIPPPHLFFVIPDLFFVIPWLSRG